MPILKLLGDFELRGDDGAALVPPARKDAALLAHLALRGAPVDRGVLAELLWPDRPEAQARKSLRQSLTALRRLLNRDGPEVLPPDRGAAVALADGALEVDVPRFERAIATGRPDEAAVLYAGPLLGGMHPPSEPFAAWLAVERTRLADRAAALFADLAEAALDRRDGVAAEAAARRALETDPLGERAHRVLMRALAAQGRRNEALQAFRRLAERLEADLGVRPDADTEALWRRIRSRAEPAAPRAAGACAAAPPDPAPPEAARAPLAGDRPGVVVLPLRVAENGHEDRALAEGLTEELIASLAAWRWFFVPSALQVAGLSDAVPPPRRLAETLGVRYALAGALRRSGNRLQIRLDLSETQRGEHLWSGRLEVFADETLAAQDALAREAAAMIEPELVLSEHAALLRRPHGDLSTWGRIVKARRLMQDLDPGHVATAVDLLRELVRREPEDAFAQAALAWAHWARFIAGDRRRETLEEGLLAADAAIAADPRHYLGHFARGACLYRIGAADRAADPFDTAAASLRRSIDLNPSEPTSYNQMIGCLAFGGRAQEALTWTEPLDRISPSDAYRGFYLCVRGMARYLVGEDAETIRLCGESLSHHPGWLPSEIFLAAAAQRSGATETALAAAQRVAAMHGRLDERRLRGVLTFKREDDYREIVPRLARLGMVAANVAGR